MSNLVLMKKVTLKQVAIAITVGVAAPLIAEYFKKRIKKAEQAKEKPIEANTDHSFIQWVGDDNFFELEGDTNIADNPHYRLLPLTSRERMKMYPTFKKYAPFNVTPAKKVKII